MNRRDSLKALGLLAAGTGLVANSCQDQTKKAADIDFKDKLPGVQDFEHERNKALEAERFFDAHEFATITLLAAIIIPKDAISGSATDAGVPDFIEFIVKDMPEHKLPMRGGLKWLDLQCHKRYKQVFLTCKEEEQIAMLDAIAYPALATPELQQGVAFFSLLRNLTASGFYTSEIGVKDIGFAGNVPGVWTGVPEDVMKEHGFDPSKFFG